MIYVQANIVGDTPCFALSVTGDSMENADIRHGDVVIVCQTARLRTVKSSWLRLTVK